MTQLLGLIATGNADMKIDIYGDDKPTKVKQLNGAHPAMKLLEGPKKRHGLAHGQARQRGKDENGDPITAYNAILRAMTKAKDHIMTLTELRPTVEGLGLNPSSANSQISLMRARGLAKRIDEGTYQLLARGMQEAADRGLVKGKPKEKTPAKKTFRTQLTKKKKPKPPPQEVVTPATTEETNG
jgi:hypothetical protein